MNGAPNFNGFNGNNPNNRGGGLPNDTPNMYFTHNPNANFNFFIGGGSPSSPQSAQGTPNRGFSNGFGQGTSLMTQDMNQMGRPWGMQGNPNWAGHPNMGNAGFNGFMGRVAPPGQGMVEPGQRNPEHCCFVVSPDGQHHCVRAALTHQQPYGQAGNSAAFRQFSPSNQGPRRLSRDSPVSRSGSNMSSPANVGFQGFVPIMEINGSASPGLDGHEEGIIEEPLSQRSVY